MRLHRLWLALLLSPILAPAADPVSDRLVIIISLDGLAHFYLDDPKAEMPTLRALAAEGARAEKRIEKVIRPEQFAEYGFPLPAKDAHAPDLILSAREGYMFSEALTGDLVITPKAEEKGTHGYEPTVPALQATFIAWGAGIQAGARLPSMRNIDVAPTAAAVLGLSMPGVEGDVLKAILK